MFHNCHAWPSFGLVLDARFRSSREVSGCRLAVDAPRSLPTAISSLYAHAYRPIVLLRPGHEVRGIPTVRSCNEHCFLYFSEALSLPSMALNDCFFLQIAWKTESTCGHVLVQGWHWKKSWYERFSPLPESPVSRNRSGSVVLTWAPQGRHSRGNIDLTPEEMLVWIINIQKRATRVCLQKKGKEKSAS